MSLFERISDKIKDDLIIEMNKTGDDDPWDDKDTKKDTKTENKKKNTKNKGKSANTGSGTDFSNTSSQTGNKKSKNTFPSGSFDPANQEKKFVENERNKNLNKDISQRRTAQDRQQQLYNRQYDAYDDGDLGNPNQTKTQTTQKTPPKKRPPRKGVDYFFDADKAKKEREAFRQGRKAYTDSKSGIKAGKVTDKGVIDYITKARNMKQGTNANTKANREAAKVIAKSSGSEYAEKIRQKYETDKDLSRRRGKNQPSYAEVKKGQPKAKTMTYLSPAGSGKPVPLKTRRIKKKIIVPPETKPVKQFDGKSFDDFIKDTKKKSKKALQDVKNIKVDPVTKFGSKLSVGNQIPYVSPPPLKDPLKGLKFKKARAVVPKNKTLRAIQRAARKNPRLALGAAILGTIGTVAVGNRLRNPKSGIGAGGTGKKDPLVANVKATYFLDPKKTQFSVNTSKDPNNPNYRVLKNPKFPK